MLGLNLVTRIRVSAYSNALPSQQGSPWPTEGVEIPLKSWSCSQEGMGTF